MFRYDRGVVGHSGYVFAQSRWVFGEYICLVVRRTGCLCVLSRANESFCHS